VIKRNSHKKDVPTVEWFFENFDPLQSVVGDIRQGWTFTPPSPHFGRNPVITMGRYRDNCYMGFINIPDHMQGEVLIAIETFFMALYGIPMKWEKHPPTVTWGECMISIIPRGIALHLKGAQNVPTLKEPQKEWERWVHRGSPNARFTLRSFLPSLYLKALWYAGSIQDVKDNLQFIMRGVGWQTYPKQWWQPSIWRFYMKYTLETIVPFSTIQAWVREGTALWEGERS
jgi:hypothetical protein